jgi:hypothetical protein
MTSERTPLSRLIDSPPSRIATRRGSGGVGLGVVTMLPVYPWRLSE